MLRLCLTVFLGLPLASSCSLFFPETYGDSATTIIHDCDGAHKQRDLTSHWDRTRKLWCDGRDRVGASHIPPKINNTNNGDDS